MYTCITFIHRKMGFKVIPDFLKCNENQGTGTSEVCDVKPWPIIANKIESFQFLFSPFFGFLRD